MVQSLDRAFSILTVVARRPAGLTAIADGVSLPKSTVSRLLRSLEQRGAVERVDETRWGIGAGLVALTAQASPERSLLHAARPHLAGLVERLGENAGLAVPDGHSVRYIDQVECGNAVQVRDWTGSRTPLHCVPSGLVLLAEWPSDAVEAFLARPLEQVTPATLVDPAAIRRRLEDVRRDGVAWGREEFVEGITSVAAPLRTSRGEVVATIHVHGPSYRFPAPGREIEVAERVVAAAGAISAGLA